MEWLLKPLLRAYLLWKWNQDTQFESNKLQIHRRTFSKNAFMEQKYQA